MGGRLMAVHGDPEHSANALEPIFDHAAERQVALDRYQAIRS